MDKLKNLFSKIGSRVEDPDDYIPLFDGSDEDPSQQISEESWGSILFSWFKGAMLLILAGAVFIGILYSFLAAFLIMWVPVGSDAGYLERENVVRNTWSETGGVPPVGDQAIVSLTAFKSETSWIDYALYGWTRIPNSAEVKVLSSDRDKLYIEVVDSEEVDEDGKVLKTGRVVILSDEGQPSFSNFTGSTVYSFDPNDSKSGTPTKDNIQLDGEVLVECLSGDCIPGTVFLVSTDQVFGEINRQ